MATARSMRPELSRVASARSKIPNISSRFSSDFRSFALYDRKPFRSAMIACLDGTFRRLRPADLSWWIMLLDEMIKSSRIQLFSLKNQI